MTDRALTPAANDVLDLTDAEFHAKYGVTPDIDLAGDIDDLLPLGRPMVDVRCALLEDSDRDGDL